MRILANYGCRNNGENFSVSFETMGDVPKDQTDSVVDDLFAKARAAVQRQQVKPEVPPEAAKLKIDNGSNGGNGGNGKLKPERIPATKKQQYKIGNLLEGIDPETQGGLLKQLLGHPVQSYAGLDKREASRVITHLLENTLELESWRV
ncbi:MAG: hypothetical protein WC081_04785 [Candidatus Ratteibacteria bacterium]|jgi:hypothetical protein